MDILSALVCCDVGPELSIFLAEQLVKGVVGTSMGFGFSLSSHAAYSATCRFRSREDSRCSTILRSSHPALAGGGEP
jgi:hypothetical protein